MPLTRWISVFTGGLREFLSDEQRVALEVEVAPDLQPQAAKLLDAVAGEESDLIVPVEVTWASTATLCDEIARAISDAARQAGAAFADTGAQPRCALPAEMSADAALPVEARVIEYAEALQRALSIHVRRLIIVLAISVDGVVSVDAQVAEAGQALGRLLAVTGTPNLKWILLSARPLLLGDDLPALRRRAHREDSPGSGLRLKPLATDPWARLETWSGPPPGGQWVEKHVAGQRVVDTPFVAFLVAGISFANPLYYYTEAGRSLTRQCLGLEQRTTGGSHVQALVDEAQEPVGYHDGELYFTELCERLAATLLRERGGLVVILAPSTVSPAESLHASVELLARHAASLRVRYIVMDARLSDASEAPRRWAISRLHYRLDPEQLEQGMKERLDAPDSSLTEHLRYRSALSAFALSKNDPATALEHSLKALELSRESTDPVEATIAWYGLGNTLYQCGAYGDAENAYAECVERALDQHRELLAAQGVAGIGHCHFMREVHDLAIGCYTTARTLWRKSRHPQGEIHALTWHAEAASKEKDHATALARLDEAIALCQAAPPSQHDAYRASLSELLLRKAAVCSKAGDAEGQKKCSSEAQSLGTHAHVCLHP
jgi:tetratricopeptide (TPR) repeat protein